MLPLLLAHIRATVRGDDALARRLEFDIDAAVQLECDLGKHHRVRGRCWKCGKELGR